MVSIALVEGTCEARAKYLESRELPSFYMADFSILGITVTDYPAAQGLLRQCGYTVIARPGGGELKLQHVSLLPMLLERLAGHGIGAILSDVADTIYQA
jgi:hypothetical protein